MADLQSEDGVNAQRDPIVYAQRFIDLLGKLPGGDPENNNLVWTLTELLRTIRQTADVLDHEP